jgi:hypothetical protein
MAHQITAIILKGRFSEEKAKEFDLAPVSLLQGLTLFHIDLYYSAYRQYKLKTQGKLTLYNIDNTAFPDDIALAYIMNSLSVCEEAEYAIIMTDYFGGAGEQWANVFRGEENTGRNVGRINEALQVLGVVAAKPYDEFDTIGLSKYRKQPGYLNKYRDLADKYGI